MRERRGAARSPSTAWRGFRSRLAHVTGRPVLVAGLAALLLSLACGCGTFRAFKESAERLGDSATATTELATVIKDDIAPPVARAAETTSKVLDWGFYALVGGAAGGLFSFAKTGWRLGMRVLGIKRRKRSKPKP